MSRSLRALLLFARVFWSYAVQWCVWRASGKRLLDSRWSSVHRRNAERLVHGFTRLRGVYIKFGQVMSVLAPFLPTAYGQLLEQLQDAVPPRSFDEIKVRLIEAYGDEPLAHFASFDEHPLAAASLAQVHRAVTRAGENVAVKVLYPGIERLIELDLAVLRLVVPVVHRIFGFQRMVPVVDQVAVMLRHETDYTHERQNIARVRAMFADRDEVVVPRVVEDLCRKSVLVMSFESGVKVTDTATLAALEIDTEQVANLLVDCYLRMLLEHRVFHADPHPGNFLVRPGNQLVILDYGAVEDLGEHLVRGLRQVFLGGLTKNADQVLRGLDEMGFVAEDGDRALLEKVGREYLKVLSELKISNFASIDPNQLQRLAGFEQLRGRLRSVAGSVRYPDGYFYVERTLVLLFGLVARLSPTRGLLGVAAPLASKAMMRSIATRPRATDRETADA